MGKDPSQMYTLNDSAVEIHEMFMSYVKAGFTRAEALSITTAILTTQITATGAAGEAGNTR
jgi:hypothetical protein